MTVQDYVLKAAIGRSDRGVAERMNNDATIRQKIKQRHCFTQKGKTDINFLECKETYTVSTIPAISRRIAVSYVLNSPWMLGAQIARRTQDYHVDNDFGNSLTSIKKNVLKTLVLREMDLLFEREELLEPYDGLLWKGFDDLTWSKCECLEEDIRDLHKEMEQYGVIDFDKHPEFEDDIHFETKLNGPTFYVEELRMIYEMAKYLEFDGKDPWDLFLDDNYGRIPHSRKKDGYIYRVINMDYNSFRRRHENGMDFYNAVFLPAGRYSLGEMFIKETLDKLKAKYEEQYKIASCADINPLPFDFAVFKDNNLSFLIEFQGKQHYKPTTFGTRDKAKGQKIWETQVRHDAMKKKWCSDNNVPLLEIDYHDINKTSKIVEDYCKKIGVV